MGIRTFAALLLGLVIQLAGLPLRAAAGPVKCPGPAAAMSCCGDVCPCLNKSEAPEKPAPAVPVASPKLVLAVVATVPPVSSAHPRPRKEVAPGPAAARVSIGFAGVPLAVAFCTFVI
jgi:hypothetical protein